MKMDLPREAALKILYDIEKNKAYSNISINKHLEAGNFSSLDRGFITELVYGTLKWKLTLDYIIGKFSTVKIKKLSPFILNILRLGVYQIVFAHRIPHSAACNESVKLAKRYGHSASSGYVNGVLRNIVRNVDNIVYPHKSRDIEEYFSVKYSYPLWMVRNWLKIYGEEFTGGFLEAGNDTPPFTVRINTLLITKEKFIEELKREEFEVEEGLYLKEAVNIKNPSGVQSMDAFKKGYFQVQDESSMLVAKVLDPKENDTVLDVCGAPGGKSTHIAQIMKNKGLVISRDIHEHKIKLIGDSASRLGIKNIKTECFDATVFDSSLEGKIDRVLVDAPCTGYGIIRRKPDIKWVRKEEDKFEICGIQKKILNISSKYVKPGGVLVYSTCTTEPMENEDMVKVFLKENKEFYLDDISSFLPHGLKKESAKEGYIQIYPHTDKIDGFFICRMRKRS